MFVIEANLDCESRWSGLSPSRAVLERISYYGLLLSVLAPVDAEVELWTPASIDLSRWRGRPLTARVGTPTRADLCWAVGTAMAANDRRLAHRIAYDLGGLPWIASLEQPDAQQRNPEGLSAKNRDELTPTGRVPDRQPFSASVFLRPTRSALGVSVDDVFRESWVAKAAWTAAGRDRVRGDGPPNQEQATRLARLLKAAGAIVVEPWCERILDLGVCATVRDGIVTAEPPHSLLVDARGGFVGIDLAEPPLEPAERALLDRAVQAAGAAIAETGHSGPFAVDAFVYREADGQRRLNPICEINARYSFGWVARAFATQGFTRLGFGPPPEGSTVLIADTGDWITAWVS